MRVLFLMAIFFMVTACVQDQGKIESGSASSGDGTTTGTTSGGTSGGTTGGAHTDPLYAYQWHLKNTGQDVGSYVNSTLGIDSTPTSGIDINVEDVHDDGDGYTGAGVKIAVSDAGVDYTHPDISGNFISSLQRNYSFVDPTRWDDSNANAYPSGNQPHGTMVSGITAMKGWNGIGGRGVAPDANFTAFKYILTDSASDHYASQLDKDIHQTDAPVDVFNYSYGYKQKYFLNDYDADIRDAFRSGTSSLRSGKGAVYVQAAGNYFEDEGLSAVGSFPADPTLPFFISDFPSSYGNTNATASLSYPEKVIAAAVSADGVKSSYSTPGSGVWISGLGGEGLSYLNIGGNYVREYIPAIFTSDIQDCSSGESYRDNILVSKNSFNFAGDRTLNPTCDYTNQMNGTSSATPMVSGVVALMLEANPALTWREVKYILADTARVIDYDPLLNELDHPDGISDYSPYVYDFKWITNAAGRMFSNWYGFGLVDAEAAVSAAKTWTSGSLGVLKITETAGIWDYSDSTIVPITDGDMTSPATATITVTDNLSIEAVQIGLATDHPYPEQLAVHITSPSGTTSRLILVNSGIVSDGSLIYYMQSNAFLDELSAGVWTIEVYDPDDISASHLKKYDGPGADGTKGTPDDDFLPLADDTGSILAWAINIYGH